MLKSIRLGVIGSAGRKEPITRAHFALMLETTRTLIADLESAGNEITALVSGGAAGADHAAVELFLRDPDRRALHLELAAAWDPAARQYADSGGSNWLTNPGRTLNRHHRAFQESAGRESFEDLHTAMRLSACRARVHDNGLHGRNTFVAQADVLLAMTFGEGPNVAPGGTADTCRKYLTRGGRSIYHLDLNTGELFGDALIIKTC